MPNSNTALATAVETEDQAQPFLFSDDSSHRHFRRTYRAARAAMAAGEDPLATFMGAPAAAPLCAPRVNDYVGLMFGIELEYESGDEGTLTEENFGDPLCGQGLLRWSDQQHYHADSQQTRLWRWEDDASVSGGEVITPILRDNRDSWNTLAEVVERMTANGAEVSARAGGHIHIDSSEIGDDAEWARFAKIITYFEDEIVRLAVNPWRRRTARDGRTLRTWHRNRRRPMDESFGGGADLTTRGGVVRAMSGRSHPISTATVSNSTGNGHIEFRLWDGSLRMPLIQMQTKITAAIIAAAMRPETDDFLNDAIPHPLGWHRAQPWRAESPGGGVRGEDWKNDTAGIKTLADILFPTSISDKEALVSLFALNPWGKVSPRPMMYW